MRALACIITSCLLGAGAAFLSAPTVVPGYPVPEFRLMNEPGAPLVVCVASGASLTREDQTDVVVRMYIDDEEWC